MSSLEVILRNEYWNMSSMTIYTGILDPLAHQQRGRCCHVTRRLSTVASQSIFRRLLCCTSEGGRFSCRSRV